MKRLLIIAALSVGGATGCLTITAYRYEPRVAPTVRIGSVPVGGLTLAEARKKLRTWWEYQKVKPIEAALAEGRGKPLEITPSKAGCALDDVASTSPLPVEDFWGATRRLFGQGSETGSSFPIVLRATGQVNPALTAYVRESLGGRKPARVTYREGQIVREPEVAEYELDTEGLVKGIAEAIESSGLVYLPLRESAKSVPDEELDKIVDVIAEYSTKFPSRQTSRNANLRIASSKIDGTVLMPGETFSFNGVVGKRTIEDGYKLAGVYKNGKHDLGLGGGICQVSGTLYNSALLANLPIVQRSNHSMPVPYLPVGRDATVDYGTLDLRFKNPYKFPIAISSTFQPGKLTFRVLGVKDPGLEVKVTTTDLKSWSRGVQYVDDPSLPAGKQKVIEKGSSGHSVTTWRIVSRNGVEVTREILSRSRYVGGVRIVARNPADASGGEL